MVFGRNATHEIQMSTSKVSIEGVAISQTNKQILSPSKIKLAGALSKDHRNELNGQFLHIAKLEVPSPFH